MTTAVKKKPFQHDPNQWIKYATGIAARYVYHTGDYGRQVREDCAQAGLLSLIERGLPSVDESRTPAEIRVFLGKRIMNGIQIERARERTIFSGCSRFFWNRKERDALSEASKASLVIAMDGRRIPKRRRFEPIDPLDRVVCPHSGDPLDIAAHRDDVDFARRLAKSIRDRRVRLVVAAIYIDGEPQTSVAARLGVSQQRIHQLAKKGLERMRETAKRWARDARKRRRVA